MKTLKHFVAAATVAGLLAGGNPAEAALSFTTLGGGIYTAGATGLNQVIPDYPGSGVGYALDFGASGLSISAITISLNISGGYNGDLYAYLSHGSEFVGLLNQITGAANSSGFAITLVTGTGNPIQTATGTPGTVLSGSTFTANNNLSAFNTTDPNGSWTLFFADMSSGDTATLNSFSVNITAVPEPVNLVLGILGVGLMGGGVVRRYWRTGQVTP